MNDYAVSQGSGYAVLIFLLKRIRSELDREDWIRRIQRKWIRWASRSGVGVDTTNPRYGVLDLFPLLSLVSAKAETRTIRDDLWRIGIRNS
ncbi:hypothetical protein Tco_1532451 [Tanacetum coccineum]